MKTEIIPEGRYLPVMLPEWGIVAHWVLAPDNTPYLAVRRTCEELGVAGPARQIQKLDDEYGDEPAIWRELRIETGGGRQPTNCLRKQEAALWIAGISPRKVKAELSGHMQTVRGRILMAADMIVFGDLTGVLTVSSTPARGGDLDAGGCPICKTHLAHHIGPDGNWLYVRDEEEPQ